MYGIFIFHIAIRIITEISNKYWDVFFHFKNIF